MSYSSLYWRLYPLKQGNLVKKIKPKKTNPCPHEGKIHHALSLWCRCSNGHPQLCLASRAACHQAQQPTNIAHSAAFVTFCLGLVGSAGGIFFLQQNSSQAVGKGQRSGLACMNWPHVKTSIWLSGVGTYLLCWVGIFCLMLLRRTKQEDKHWRRKTNSRTEAAAIFKMCSNAFVNGPSAWPGWAFVGVGSSSEVVCLLRFNHAQTKGESLLNSSPLRSLQGGCRGDCVICRPAVIAAEKRHRREESQTLRRPGEPWLGRQTAPALVVASLPLLLCIVLCSLLTKVFKFNRKRTRVCCKWRSPSA